MTTSRHQVTGREGPKRGITWVSSLRSRKHANRLGQHLETQINMCRSSSITQVLGNKSGKSISKPKKCSEAKDIKFNKSKCKLLHLLASTFINQGISGQAKGLQITRGQSATQTAQKSTTCCHLRKGNAILKWIKPALHIYPDPALTWQQANRGLYPHHVQLQGIFLQSGPSSSRWS